MLGVIEKTISQNEMTFDGALYKRILMKMFKQYDVFCRQHNLKYSVAFGTMLGTIRHQGLIPWDDDIDVYMPRADYDEFLRLTTKGMTENYDVLSPYNCPTYYLRYAKVIDNRTTLIETKYNKNCVIGVFLDVFPVDNFGKNGDVTSACEKKVRRHMYRAVLLQQSPFVRWRGMKSLVKWVVYKLIGDNAQKEWIKADLCSKQFYETKSYRMIYYGGMNCFISSFPAFFFDNLVDVPFEDLSVMCFENSDAYLTYMYGDYMQLPPVENRISHHYHYFVDLNRRWTREELKIKGII